MKVKIRFTNNKGTIEEMWLRIGDRLPVVYTNDWTGHKEDMATFEIMAVEDGSEKSKNGGASRQEG